MASKKITNEEFADLVRPHQRALLDIAKEYGVAIVIGIDTSSLTGKSTWTTSMFAAGPVCPPVGVALMAMSEGTDPELVDIADLLLSGDFSDVETVGSQKIGRA